MWSEERKQVGRGRGSYIMKRCPLSSYQRMRQRHEQPGGRTGKEERTVSGQRVGGAIGPHTKPRRRSEGLWVSARGSVRVEVRERGVVHPWRVVSCRRSSYLEGPGGS
jgi:hypothetical protein